MPPFSILPTAEHKSGIRMETDVFREQLKRIGSSSSSLQLGEILDCWRQIRWYRYSIISPNMSQRSQIMHTSGTLVCASSRGPLSSGRASSSFPWFWCRTKRGLVRKRIRKRWVCQFEAEKGEKREKVDFSHDRWEPFQNPTIKAFAGNYLLIWAFSWDSTVEKC
jgi:hypothetical protein